MLIALYILWDTSQFWLLIAVKRKIVTILADKGERFIAMKGWKAVQLRDSVEVINDYVDGIKNQMQMYSREDK